MHKYTSILRHSDQIILTQPFSNIGGRTMYSAGSPRSLSDLRLTAQFLPFSEEASLLLAPSEPPSFAFAAIRGGFSSLSHTLLKRSLREASLRLASQKQASCLLLPSRLRSLSPACRQAGRLVSEKNHQKSP